MWSASRHWSFLTQGRIYLWSLYATNTRREIASPFKQNPLKTSAFPLAGFLCLIPPLHRMSALPDTSDIFIPCKQIPRGILT